MAKSISFERLKTLAEKGTTQTAIAKKHGIPQSRVWYAYKYKKDLILGDDAKGGHRPKGSNGRKIAEANAMLNGHDFATPSEKLARIGRNLVDVGLQLIEEARMVR